MPWLVYAMLLAPLGLILIAAVVKTWQVRQTRSWPQTSGKVVVSASELRDVEVDDDEREDGKRLEQRNFANIVYEYEVNGRKLRCNRVSIGEDLGNSEIAETLAKYLAGSIVTVYYNPRHPGQAVLERDPPKGLWGCLGIGSAVVIAIVFGAAFGFNQIHDVLLRRMARPDLSGMVIGLGAFGIVAALFGFAVRKQASAASRWPVVPGTIHVSEMEEYRGAAPDGRGRGTEMYGRRVSYSYAYANVSYTNECARVGAGSAATSDKMLKRMLSRYPDGAAVEVHVNPANPAEAALDARGDGRFAFVLWAISALFVATAVLAATRGG
jgi:hypothetical protein